MGFFYKYLFRLFMVFSFVFVITTVRHFRGHLCGLTGSRVSHRPLVPWFKSCWPTWRMFHLMLLLVTAGSLMTHIVQKPYSWNSWVFFPISEVSAVIMDVISSSLVLIYDSVWLAAGWWIWTKSLPVLVHLTSSELSWCHVVCQITNSGIIMSSDTLYLFKMTSTSLITISIWALVLMFFLATLFLLLL